MYLICLKLIFGEKSFVITAKNLPMDTLSKVETAIKNFRENKRIDEENGSTSAARSNDVRHSSDIISKTNVSIPSA